MDLLKPSYATGYAKNASQSAHPNLWDGLVGAWMPSLGVTGETLRDVSGNGNHGTLTNMDAATDWVATSKGLALDFDGSNDFVDTGIDPSFDALTISCWFQYSNTYLRVALGRYTEWYNPGVFRITANGIIGLGDQAPSGGYGEMLPSSSLTFSTGQWVNTVFTYDGKTYRSYHQGIAGGTLNRTHTFASSGSQNIWIGRRTSVPTYANYFLGNITNVSIYNRALSPTEIKHLYVDSLAPFRTKKRTVVRVPAAIPAATKVGSIKKPTTIIKPSYQAGYARNASESENPNLWDGLAGAWMPSLGVTGDTLRDVSGNGNHGTLTGMDTATDWVATSKGLALDFDGVNDVVLSRNLLNGLAVDRGLTFTACIKPDSLASQGFISGVWGQSRTLDQAGFFVINSGVLVAVNGGTGDESGFGVSNTLTTGEWQFIAGTWTYDGVYKVYQDGRFLGSGYQSTSGFLSSSPIANFHIGSQNTTGFRAFDGSISNTSIYNRALSTTEIKQLYVDSLAPFRKKQRVSVAVPAAVAPSATYHPLRSLAHPLEQ